MSEPTDDKGSGPPQGGPDAPDKPGAPSTKVPDAPGGGVHSVRIPPERPAMPPTLPTAQESPLRKEAAAPAETPVKPAAAPPAAPAMPVGAGGEAAPAAPKPPAAPAPAPAAAKKPATPPAPQIPRNPGAAARVAKAATIVGDKEQEPLAGSADLGWNVLNVVMTVGVVALAIIAIVSCAKMMGALFGVLGSAPQ